MVKKGGINKSEGEYFGFGWLSAAGIGQKARCRHPIGRALKRKETIFICIANPTDDD